MAAQGISYYEGLFQRYLKCSVPDLTNAKTVACAHAIFCEIGQVDRSVLLDNYGDRRRLEVLLRQIDGAQNFVRSFLPVLEAASLVLNASVELPDPPKLQEQIDTLLSLGLDELCLGLDELNQKKWKEFYETVLAKLCELSAPSVQGEEGTSALDSVARHMVGRVLELALTDDSFAAAQSPERRFKDAETQTLSEQASLSKERFRKAEAAYFIKQDYRKVLELLPDPETFEEVCLVARALTKLERFEEAQEKFGRGFELAKPEERHLLLHRRADAYLQEYKNSKNPDLLMGCIASLTGALANGKSIYAALVALDASKSADQKAWSYVASQNPKTHDLMWGCAALLCENPELHSQAGELMQAFPMRSVAGYMNEEDSLQFLQQERTMERTMTPPLAILSGWHWQKCSLEGCSLESVTSLTIYERLRDSARVLSSKGLRFLAAECAQGAWALSSKVGCRLEATILYASTLAQKWDFQELERWGRKASEGIESEEAALVKHLINAFCDHHKGARSDALVREEFEWARALFPVASRDPYWRAVLKRHFPGEDFAEET